MALIHRVDQVSADVVALTCHQCRIRYPADEITTAGDPLQCPDCLGSGFVAHKASKLTERFGDAFAGAWTPLPEALMDQRAALGLEPHDLLIVWALERHRRVMGDVVYPGQQTLADLTGLSIHQVRRATRRLITLKLIVRHAQPGSRGKGGRERVQYDLDPLWHRLVGEHQRTPTTEQVGEHERTPTPAEAITAEVGAHQCTEVGAQNGGGWCAESTPEVDVDVDAVREADPVGASPPDLAAANDPADDPETQRWAEFTAWRKEHHPRMRVGDAWTRYIAEQEQAA